MSTAALLRQSIADELNRQPSELIGSPSLSVGLVILRCINEAIRHYESMRTSWGEIRDYTLATTVAGTRYYSLSSSAQQFLSVDSLKLIYSDSYIKMNKRSYEELDEKDRRVSGSQGIPQDFTTYAKQLRVYPVPNGAYDLLVSGLVRPRLTSLTGSYTGTGSSSPTSTASHNNRTGGWYDHGASLIKARAKALVEINYLKSSGAKQEQVVLAGGGETFLSIEERSAYAALRDETNGYLSTGKIKPYRI